MASMKRICVFCGSLEELAQNGLASAKPLLVSSNALRRAEAAFALIKDCARCLHPLPVNWQHSLLNTNWSFDHGVREGFVRPAHRNLVISNADPLALLEQMQSFVPQDLPKWISPAQA